MKTVACPACGLEKPSRVPAFAAYRSAMWEVCACGALYERPTGRHIGTLLEASDPRKPPTLRPLGAKGGRFRYLGAGKFRIDRRT